MAVPDRSHDGPMIAPERSDSRADFLLFAQQLFNFELERYRAASVSFVDCLFLFHVSLNQRILDFRYPGSLFHSEIWVCLHSRSPRTLLTIEHSRLGSAGDQTMVALSCSFAKGSTLMRHDLPLL